MEFKVGDRVRFSGNEEGTGSVTGISYRQGTEFVDVVWDGRDTSFGYYPEDLELVGEQPNRTYYEGQDFLETVSKFAASTQVSPEDVRAVHSLGKQLGIGTFEQNVHRILNGVAETVVQKNVSYGDSALNPIRVFSKADRMEQLFVRLDDKLSRVQRGSEYPGDDTLRDIIGYATLILIARESE